MLRYPPMEFVYRGLRRSIQDGEPLRHALARHLNLPQVDRVVVDREAIDARQKPEVYYVYNLRFTAPADNPCVQSLLAQGIIERYVPVCLPEPEPRFALPDDPMIIGSGPAGLFLGLYLARMGYRPILFERGEAIDARARSVDRLWGVGELNPESNLQFGEGGAGAFSDGKLTVGKSSPLDRLILEDFVRAGAPETILFSNKPHIGTDYLRRVVAHLREEIVALGGEIHFGHKLSTVHLRGGAVRGVTVSGQRLSTKCLILAVGHSARDTVQMLHALGVAMQPKPFAIGTRIEHPVGFINEMQYGKRAARILPAADYRLTHRHKGLGVYSFCMCPGGYVVCASSEPGGQVTNGMSRYARDGSHSNSAIVVGVAPESLGLSSPLDAIAYQRELELRAFRAGGGGYFAPAQRAADWVRGRRTHDLPETTYRPGVTPSWLDGVLPDFVAEAIKAGLAKFDRIMPGFIEKGVCIGLESRTSSPVRLLRDENCESVSTRGLYLLGEGAGYAGGIMTCARDAVRFARLVMPRD